MSIRNGQLDAVQLIVLSRMKNDFIKQVHGGMCGGEAWLLQIGEGMFSSFADNAKLVRNTSEVSCQVQPTSSHY